MEMIIKALGRNVNPEMQIEEERMSETEKMAVPTQIKPATRYLAELIGTMVLVLMGCGSASLRVSTLVMRESLLFSVLLC
jgi:hypothetical protein